MCIDESYRSIRETENPFASRRAENVKTSVHDWMQPEHEIISKEIERKLKQ